jgi:alpha-D-xyloside xylohydrolase
MLYYNKLRYRLMPYIYSLAGKTYFDNYTIMRGLPMDFSTDEAVKNIGDQFMFGPAILVNPVYEYKSRSRKVYLPNTNGWYDFYTGKFFDGGQTILADAPYETLPLYVKEGSIIPCGPNIQYTAEKSSEPFTIYVYTGNDASFSLYEDEAINYNYEKGQFATVQFNYNEANKALSIEDRNGSFAGMTQQRTYKIVWISKSKPGALAFESKADATVEYSGKKVVVKFKK